jgi:hypothetical protein
MESWMQVSELANQWGKPRTVATTAFPTSRCIWVASSVCCTAILVCWASTRSAGAAWRNNQHESPKGNRRGKRHQEISIRVVQLGLYLLQGTLVAIEVDDARDAVGECDHFNGAADFVQQALDKSVVNNHQGNNLHSEALDTV